MKHMKKMDSNNMQFSISQRPYIIAEVGANHNGDMELASKMIRVAKEIGCDAVKFQSWDEGLFAKIIYEENKFIGDDYRERSDHSLKTIMAEFKVTRDQLGELSEYCNNIGVNFLSTPFSPTQIDDLVSFGVRFIKIASMDLVSDYLLRHAARTGLPIVLSTGFGTLEEIDHAVQTIEREGNRQIVLLHCVALYPPPDEYVNLANIEMLRTSFGYPVGFSDHTLGIDIALASFARGAMMLEKHFTLDKEMFGWDHKISADVPEMAAICTARGRIHAAIGVQRRVVSSEERGRTVEFRRSIVAARDIRKGETITERDITYRRPGRGLTPNYDRMVIGCVAARDIAADDLLDWSDLTSITS
jgi:sialic acid synthase SpsE